jgi:hypothetical protein
MVGVSLQLVRGERAVFNDPAHVTRKNCYCFASNHLADVRYARPGQRAGQPAQAITCAGVVAGLRADSWEDGCEPNALTIVFVIWARGLDVRGVVDALGRQSGDAMTVDDRGTCVLRRRRA